MKIKMNAAAAACAIMFAAGVLALFVDDSIMESSSSMGLFRRLQESCEVFFTGGGDGAYWENSYPDIHYYPGEERELPGGPNNIAFVVPMNSCPEDVAYDAAIDTQYDPGHNLYDAAAVLKHSIESNLAATGKYNATMHAIFHMGAVECIDPNGNLYDRVKVVESLGYYANIKESPVTEGEAPDKVDAMANDAGYRDLTKLHAFEYEENPAVVLTDFDSIVNPEVPLEPVIDEFIASPAQVALDPAAPPADMSMVMLKPDPTMVDTLKDEFENTPYDTTTGWDGTGVGAGEGGVSAGGILANHYTNVDPSALMTLDHCKYGNDHEGACLDTPTSEIAVNKISTCGAPWTCPDISGLSAAEQKKCTAMQSTWYANRIDFEDNCWNAPADLQAPRTGSSGGGFCEGTGTDAYSRMITDKRAPQSCDPKTVTNYDTGVIAFGSGKFQAQKLTLTTGEYTGQDEICVDGYLAKAGFEPPYNICIVLDVSGSTRAPFGGTPTGDVNGDGYADTILDAEIASILKVLEYIAESGDLGNHNVDIGFVIFSSYANYLGRYLPVDSANPTKVHPATKSMLMRLRSGGYTHFDDALDKAVEYFSEAPLDRSNLMFFLSDGIPNIGGDGDNEPILTSPTNNHPSVLMYNSELALLDSYNVHRLAVGVGYGSDTRPGYGLALIDNTPDEETGVGPEKVTTTDALTDVLLSNPVVGNIIDFKLWVNNVQDTSFGVGNVNPGPVGFTYGTLIVPVPNFLFGTSNTVKVAVLVDYDGNPGTTNDQLALEVENVVKGGLTRGTEFLSRRRLRVEEKTSTKMSPRRAYRRLDTSRQCYQNNWPHLYELVYTNTE